MRRKGEGSIFYRKSRNSWYATITNPFTKKKEISPAFSTDKEALAWLTQTNASILNKTFVTKNAYTVGAWVLEYLKTYAKSHVKETTLLRYTEIAGKLSPISKIKLQNLESVHVQQLMNDLPPTMASSSKNKVFKLLRQMLDQAVRCRLIVFNPCSVLKGPKVVQEEIKIFSPEEIALILRKVQVRTRAQTQLYKHHDIILLAATTGMRLGELLGLQWADIDFKDASLMVKRTVAHPNGKLVITSPKTAAGVRKIPLPMEVINVLKKRKKNEPVLSSDGSDFVFHARLKRKVPLRSSTIERAWKSILTYVGLPHRRFHSLRHTHATQLLGKGLPILEVSRRLGHSRASHTLDMYGHAIPEMRSEVIQKIEEIYNLK